MYVLCDNKHSIQFLQLSEHEKKIDCQLVDYKSVYTIN